MNPGGARAAAAERLSASDPFGVHVLLPDTDSRRDRSPDRAGVAADVRRALVTAVTVPPVFTLDVMTPSWAFLEGLMAPLVGLLNRGAPTSGVAVEDPPR